MINSTYLSRFIMLSLPVRGAWIEIGIPQEVTLTSKMSLPVRGAWIEIHTGENREKEWRGRSPCGERGLKSAASSSLMKDAGSLPVRGAWIEIHCDTPFYLCAFRRSPCGERGLKCSPLLHRENRVARRSPCGERGLKCAVSRKPTGTL